MEEGWGGGQEEAIPGRGGQAESGTTGRCEGRQEKGFGLAIMPDPNFHESPSLQEHSSNSNPCVGYSTG